jgi:integrase
MKWAHRQGYIDINPVAEMEAPSAERREVHITEDQYAQLLGAIRAPGFHDLVVTTWETGCRPQQSLRVEARHVDLQNQRWVFPKSESKKKQMVRVVFLTDAALAASRRLMVMYPTGPLFRNSRGEAWTNYAVQCAFRRVRGRVGKELMKELGIDIEDREIGSATLSLARAKTSGGIVIAKTAAQLRAETRRKLIERRAIALAPLYSLYALRHNWATRALERGLDALTVAILMGHKDPGMLAKVYQHLTLNPKHLLSELRRVAG